MAKKSNNEDKKLDTLMWSGIEEDSFFLTDNTEDVDIAEYNLENMVYFFANTNYFRQMIRLSDGLKPVVRRILITAYKNKAYGGTRMKSPAIVGDALKIHAHSDASIYATMVSLAQRWVMPVPLIKGKGNFGNETDSPYAASRYTEAGLSKYGYECFFADYDPECIEMLHNTASDTDEPMSLPTKFPNILINGGVGFAPCNAFRVPPYNIDDIIKNIKKVLVNPDCTDIYMVPDLPTGCPIVNMGNSINEICETGTGTLRMRADIEIEETVVNRTKYWSLNVKNVPWMVSLRMIKEKLVKLKKTGVLNFEDAQDHSYPIKLKDGSYAMVIDYRIIIDHALDPYAFRSKVYKLTELDKGIAINLKAVVDELKVKKFSLKMLIQAWIDERRSYKRRLYNKKLVRVNERIDFLRVLIDILDPKKYNKTMNVIRNSSDADLLANLSSLANMTTFQANQIAESRTRYLTKEALERYRRELPERLEEQKELEAIIQSETKIDQIIIDELNDLKKYATPRKSQLIEDSENGEAISDTEHIIVISNQGYIKKLPYYEDQPKMNHNFGNFNNGDYPINVLKVHNTEQILFFDNIGRYSVIPVHKIDSCEPSSVGYRLFDITKLNGKIIQMIRHIKTADYDKVRESGNDLYVVSLSQDGTLKKTSLSEYLQLKSTKNVRATKTRDGDFITHISLIQGNPKIMIYTKKGKYLYTSLAEFEPSKKDTVGLMTLKVDSDDQCIGVSIIPDKAKYIGVITEKGLVKKCEIEFMGTPNKRRGAPTYLATLDTNDNIFFACPLRNKDDITVITTQNVFTIEHDKIPILTRKAKGSKLIPVPLGSKILRAESTRQKGK